MSKTIQKIRGAVLGYAIGDALGLGTEFMTREEVRMHYPETLTDYPQIVEDAHRSMWGKGNCSHDTTFVLALIDIIMQTDSIDARAFATRMLQWYERGQYDVSPQLRMVLSNPDYAADPYGVTERTWQKFGKMTESNSALGIGMTSGIFSKNIEEDAVAICRTFSHDPRVRGCCVVAAQAASMLLRDEIISPQQACDIAARFSPDIKTYIKFAADPDPMAILNAEIDDEDTLWMIRKALCTALWALWHADSFGRGLTDVINLGGDADTNGAAAGMLLGLRFGADNIPENLTSGLGDIELIERYANAFADYLERRL